jgi:hypothetical protein
MAHQGYDLQLTRYRERGWRATFYTTGMEDSPPSGTALLPHHEAVLVQTNHSHEFEDDDDLYRSRSASRRKNCQPRSRTSRRCARFRYSTYPPDRFSS